jgi:hypothetical protein
MTDVEVLAGVDVDVPVPEAWAMLVDWERQSEWMLGTDVRATTRSGGRGVGSGIVARTGAGRLAVSDPMTIEVWDPPHLCVMRHEGRLIRGTGTFRVTDIGDGRSCVLWSEQLELPLAPVARVGWPVVRRVVHAGMALSLRRFAGLVGQG